MYVRMYVRKYTRIYVRMFVRIYIYISSSSMKNNIDILHIQLTLAQEREQQLNIIHQQQQHEIDRQQHLRQQQFQQQQQQSAPNPDFPAIGEGGYVCVVMCVEYMQCVVGIDIYILASVCRCIYIYVCTLLWDRRCYVYINMNLCMYMY